MSQKPQRRGLGRGLGALIPTAPVEAPQEAATTSGSPTATEPGAASHQPRTAGATPGRPGDGHDGSGLGGQHDHVERASGTDAPASGDDSAYFAEIPLAQIVPNPRQPRQVFDEEAMAELVHSLREIGLLQPIVVRRTAPEGYELIMGERRWRAAQEAGLETIPAIVRQTDDNDMLRDALLENLHRSQLNPLEEAAAYGQLLDDFGCTHDELAQRIGRSRPQISNTLRLLRLSPAVQRRVGAGVLSAGHARALLAVDDADVQDRLAQRVVAEGISVRGLEEIVAVGDDAGSKKKAPKRQISAPGLSELSDRLADRLETRVKIDLGKSKGKIVVEFATMDDLQRIIDVMDPRNRQDRPI